MTPRPDDQLDEQTRAYVDRLVEQAPRLSVAQERVITTAFAAESEADTERAGDA
jgi:hypothetical protein